MAQKIYAQKLRVVELDDGSNPVNPVEKLVQKAPETIKELQKKNDDDNKTVLLGGAAESGKTVLLSDVTNEIEAMITRSSTGEKTKITNSVFKIGKKKDHVDYCISDNLTISGIHAQIEFDDGTYYLVDKNSSNGTKLRGRKIDPEERYLLQNGDNIVFSNETFVFEIL